MKPATKAIFRNLCITLLLGSACVNPVLADDWDQQPFDSVSFGGLFEGNSKDMYFGYTRYQPGGIGIGAEIALYRYKHENNDIDYSSTYTERDLSLTLPIAATEKVYLTPAIGVRQIKNKHDLEGFEHSETHYEALYGLDITYMLNNVSITIGADKSKSSEWSVSYGLGVSF